MARNSDPGYLEHDLKGRVWDPCGYVSQTRRLLAPWGEMEWKKTKAWLVAAKGSQEGEQDPLHSSTMSEAAFDSRSHTALTLQLYPSARA